MKVAQLRQLVATECDRLTRLGSSQAVATELARRGMTGKPGDTCECPLARALSDTLMVGTGLIRVGEEDVFSHGPFERPFRKPRTLAMLSDVLTQFVFEFDAGEYPHLVQGGRS